MPDRWEDGVALVAYFYRFQPSEMWAMDIDELIWWHRKSKLFSPHG